MKCAASKCSGSAACLLALALVLEPADPDPDVEHICGQNIFLVAVHKKSPLQLSSPCCRHMPGPRVRSCKTSSDHDLSKNILTFL